MALSGLVGAGCSARRDIPLPLYRADCSCVSWVFVRRYVEMLDPDAGPCVEGLPGLAGHRARLRVEWRTFVLARLASVTQVGIHFRAARWEPMGRGSLGLRVSMVLRG